MPRQKNGATISKEMQREMISAGNQPPEEGAARFSKYSMGEFIQC
jgi:hypothetical protein